MAPDEIAYAVAVFVSAANETLSLGRRSSLTSRAKRECEDVFFALYCAAPSQDFDEEGTQGASLYKSFRTLWEQYEGDAGQRSVCARVLAFYFLMERTRGTVVQEWIRLCPETPEAVVLDDAVIAAIGIVALGERGSLPEDLFISTVKALALKRHNHQDIHISDARPAGIASVLPVMAVTGSGSSTDNLAERLLAYEIARGDDFSNGEMSAAVAVCEKFQEWLTAVAGKEVFRTLLTRALTLSKREVPALEGAWVGEDGALKGIDHAPVQASEILVGHLVRLPAAVIGENLTFCLLQEVWPDLASFETQRPNPPTTTL